MLFELEEQEKKKKKKSSGVWGILGLKFFHSLKQIHINRQFLSPSLLTLTEGHPSSWYQCKVLKRKITQLQYSLLYFLLHLE